VYILRGQSYFYTMVITVAVLLFVGAGLYWAFFYTPAVGTGSPRYWLYFANREATEVVGEKRAQKGVLTGETIIEELIKGPRTQNLWPTLPQGTRLLSFFVQGRIAYVDFSREVKENFGGGTANELMLVYSVIASLTELPEIAAVQFLVEGQVEESIWGHIDTSSPLMPDEQFIAR